jgi:uncharacterized protein YndB with AHSA1/START domain
MENRTNEKPEDRQTRTIEVELDIDAAVSRVWQALTDPADLARWFPLIARVQPEVGGFVELSWGPDLNSRNAILAWKPERHLRTNWFEHGATETNASAEKDGSPRDPGAWARLKVDFYLEEKGDRTVVRMVHSGFGRDASWDEEYAAHARGWSFELRSLVHYLEHHAGRERHVAWVRRPIALPREQAWARLAGAEGMLREGRLEGLEPGEAYAITTADGTRFEGRVIHHLSPIEFAGTVENLDHALLRFGIEDYGAGPEASLWLSTWGEPTEADAHRGRFDRILKRVF